MQVIKRQSKAKQTIALLCVCQCVCQFNIKSMSFLFLFLFSSFFLSLISTLLLSLLSYTNFFFSVVNLQRKSSPHAPHLLSLASVSCMYALSRFYSENINVCIIRNSVRVRTSCDMFKIMRRSTFSKP